MADAIQVYKPPMLLWRYDTQIDLAMGESEIINALLPLVPVELEYVLTQVASAGALDYDLNIFRGNPAEATVYSFVNAGENILDNLVKPMAVGGWQVDIDPDTGVLTVTVFPDNPVMRVQVINNSADDLAVTLIEIGYRAMNRGMDLAPVLDAALANIAGTNVVSV
jgi:hypothetical protein